MKLLPITILAFCSLLSAQSDRTVPNEYATAWGGNNGTGTVFGGTKGIMQGLYIKPMPTSALILGVGFRRTAGTTDYNAVTLDVEVVLSSSTKTLMTLTNTFATNLEKDTAVVFTRKMFNVAARSANTSPKDWVVLPTARPWLFRGPNLIVQVKKFASSWSSTGWRNDRCFETTNRGDAISFGKACGKATHSSTSSSSYLPGTAIKLTISGAPSQTAALLFLGGDLTSFLSAQLPLDMGIIGMRGCLLRVAPILILPTATNQSGAGEISLPVPRDPKLSGTALATQYFYVDKNAGNTLGALMTNGRFIQIGPLPCANRYVWDLFDETKATGTLQPGGPIVLLRTRP